MRLVRGVLVLCAFLLGFGVRATNADPFADAVAALGADGFAARAAAVERLADLGDPRAVPVLRAMSEGQLLVRKADGALAIQDGTRAYDPVTNQTLVSFNPDDYETVRLNNRLRSTLRGALGRLVLFSPDPRERLEAAIGVFKTRSVENLPLLRKAIAAETDADVLAQLRLSLAATQLLSDDRAERLAGIAGLAGAADVEVRAMLLQLAADGEPDAEVRRRAADAVAALDRRLATLRLVQNLIQGLSLGAVLLLAAMGLTITFGVMGVINMAYGEMVMIGAYATFVVQQLVREYALGLTELTPILAIPTAFVVAGALGIALERSVIRHLYGRPLETLLMTWGVSMILQQAVRSIFGATNREVASPSWMSGAIEIAGGITVTQNRIWIILFSLAVLAAVILATRLTRFGLYMRAVTQNRGMASAMGIRTGRIDALTFGLGSGIAGMAGVALSQIDNVSPNLGQAYIVDSFMVVVFGGVGNLYGTLLGAISLGVINKFLEPYAGAVLGKILVLVAVILFIQRRPRGLFALKGRAAEV